MSHQKIDEIFKKLDLWVAANGSKRYIPEDFEEDLDNNFNISENFGIQQVRKEIYEFTKILLQNKTHTCMEIGFGFYGSTHILWREIFEKVITIEYQLDRVWDFRENTNKFYGDFIFNDKKSQFIFGSSHNPSCLGKLDKLLVNKKLDLLFIDGDHKYESVMADYLLYKDFVGQGGIIAFHDTKNNINNYGVRKCMDQIKMRNNKIKFIDLHFSKSVGISYYIVE